MSAWDHMSEGTLIVAFLDQRPIVQDVLYMPSFACQIEHGTVD
jgi:hypothetical protein